MIQIQSAPEFRVHRLVRRWTNFLPVVFLLAIFGCSTSSKLAEEPDYDILEGDFLSEKEFEDLDKDDAIAYCLELTQEVDIQKDNAVLTEEQVEELQTQLHESKDRLLKLQIMNQAREDSISAGEGRAVGTPTASGAKDGAGANIDAGAVTPGAADHYAVVPGDWLSTIAARSEIYGDWKAWRRLYDANRGLIEEPNLIFPGQVLAIPREALNR